MRVVNKWKWLIKQLPTSTNDVPLGSMFLESAVLSVKMGISSPTFSINQQAVCVGMQRSAVCGTQHRLSNWLPNYQACLASYRVIWNIQVCKPFEHVLKARIPISMQKICQRYLPKITLGPSAKDFQVRQAAHWSSAQCTACPASHAASSAGNMSKSWPPQLGVGRPHGTLPPFQPCCTWIKTKGAV